MWFLVAGLTWVGSHYPQNALLLFVSFIKTPSQKRVKGSSKLLCGGFLIGRAVLGIDLLHCPFDTFGPSTNECPFFAEFSRKTKKRTTSFGGSNLKETLVGSLDFNFLVDIKLIFLTYQLFAEGSLQQRGQSSSEGHFLEGFGNESSLGLDGCLVPSIRAIFGHARYRTLLP